MSLPSSLPGFGRRVRSLFAACLVALAVAGCGGGGEPTAAATPDVAMSTLRAKSKALAQNINTQQLAEQLFNLAESAFPSIFSSHEVTFTYYGFYLRYYPATGVYLGVVYDSYLGYELNGVYALGGVLGNDLRYGGPLSYFLPAAGPLPTMQSGTTPFSLAYAGTSVGIDMRSTPATFASDNTMNGYNFSAQEAPLIGTMSNYETSGSQTVQIGRWANGTFAGRFYSIVDATHTLSLTANQGFHYALATVPDRLPCSGSKTYTLVSSTRPTLEDGTASSGLVDQLTATVSFTSGTPTVSMTGAVTIDGAQRTFNGTLGSWNAAWKMFTITAPAQPSGASSAVIYGSFGGADSGQLGVAATGMRMNSNNPGKNLQFAARLSQSQTSSVACS